MIKAVIVPRGFAEIQGNVRIYRKVYSIYRQKEREYYKTIVKVSNLDVCAMEYRSTKCQFKPDFSYTSRLHIKFTLINKLEIIELRYRFLDQHICSSSKTVNFMSFKMFRVIAGSWQKEKNITD